MTDRLRIAEFEESYDEDGNPRGRIGDVVSAPSAPDRSAQSRSMPQARGPDRTGQRGTRAASDKDDRAETRIVNLVPASTVRPERTRWAWRDRIPLGGVVLLVGQEGSGKTTLLVDVLARATRGQLDGDLYGQPVAAAYATAEDSWSRTLRPRLEAAGADLELVRFVDVDGFGGGLTIPGDLTSLAETMREARAAIVVLDPLGAHLHGSLDTHRDASVRRALAPLAARMNELGAVSVCVMHWSKAPTTVALDRVNGSRGFTAAARGVLAVGDDPQDQSSRVLVVAKSNLGRTDVPALRFRIEPRQVDDGVGGTIETSTVAWLGEAPGVTARDLLRPVDPDEMTSRARLAEFILDTLAEGPLARGELDGQVAAAGFTVSSKTIQRALERLALIVHVAP